MEPSHAHADTTPPVTCRCGAVVGTRVQILTRFGPQLWLTLCEGGMPLEYAHGRCLACGQDWIYKPFHGSLAKLAGHTARRAARGH